LGCTKPRHGNSVELKRGIVRIKQPKAGAPAVGERAGKGFGGRREGRHSEVLGGFGQGTVEKASGKKTNTKMRAKRKMRQSPTKSPPETRDRSVPSWGRWGITKDEAFRYKKPSRQSMRKRFQCPGTQKEVTTAQTRLDFSEQLKTTRRKPSRTERA